MFENIPELKQYVDIETGLSRVRGNKALFAKMLGMYLGSTEFDNLDQQLALGNLEEAAKVAHTLKGMTGNLSLEMVFQLSSDLLSSLREGIYDPAAVNALRDANVKTKEYINMVIEEFGK